MVRYHAERRPIMKAIRTEPQYLDVSHYAMQLTPYLDLFGPARVAVLTYEELTRAPVATMCRLYEWLGVDSSVVDVSGFDQPENVTPEVLRKAAWLGVPQRLRQSRPSRFFIPYLRRTAREKAVRRATRQVNRRGRFMIASHVRGTQSAS
jgi:hypothetical protein